MHLSRSGAPFLVALALGAPAAVQAGWLDSLSGFFSAPAASDDKAADTQSFQTQPLEPPAIKPASESATKTATEKTSEPAKATDSSDEDSGWFSQIKGFFTGSSERAGAEPKEAPVKAAESKSAQPQPEKSPATKPKSSEPKQASKSAAEPAPVTDKADEDSGWFSQLKGYFAHPGGSGGAAFDDPASTATATAAHTATAPPQQSGNPSDFVLPGKWTLNAKDSRKKVGSLTADADFFSLVLDEPKLDLRLSYVQGSDGHFRSTLLDDQVIVIEGDFANKDQIHLRVDTKGLGKPDVKSYEMLASRDK